MPIIQVFPLDLRPPWGTLIEPQALANHYIHQAWHTLSSPSPQSPMNLGKGPLGLSPLDIRVIEWDIPKDGICLLELFRGISFKLVVVIYSCIIIRKYHYKEKDL